MLKRYLQLPKKSFFLFGSRQTGKSTLIRSQFPKAWYVNLLNSDELFEYYKNPSLFRQQAIEKIKNNTQQIIVDEIQRNPILLNDIQSIMFDYPAVQFIITGSSARKLKRGQANLLAGRAVVEYLFPFIYKETTTSTLENLLRWGSLPALIDCTDAQKAAILNTYARVYLEEEIKSEGIARNIIGFTRFLDIAASQCGELLSFSAISRECFLPIRTVQSYYEILEDTLIGFRLLAWDKSIRKRIVAHPKFYLFDIGITNALNRRLNAMPDAITQGRLFEQLIILETFRMLHYLHSESRIFFWRTNSGAEVDLIIEQGGEPKFAIEIKKTKNVSSAHLTGLKSFRNDYPKTSCLLIADIPHPYEIDGIKIISWDHYLKNIETFL